MENLAARTDEVVYRLRMSLDPKHKLLQEDALLAARCAAGEVDAWEEIYRLHHASLVRTIAVLLGSRGSDRDLVDELTARVWYRLVEQDSRLLNRYSPDRGARLITFMRAIARDVIRRHYRSEMRRQRREQIAAGTKSVERFSGSVDRSLSEFLATLSPSERRFTNDYLLSDPVELGSCSTVEPRKSDASIWQFRRRVRVKLQRFLGH